MNINEWAGTQLSQKTIEQAAFWVAKLDTENDFWAGQENERNNAESFYAWLAQDTLHQIAFVQMSELWAKTSFISHTEHLLERSSIIPFPASSKPDLDALESEQVISLLESDSTEAINKNALLQDTKERNFAPAWAYHLTICTMVFGMSISFLAS